MSIPGLIRRVLDATYSLAAGVAALALLGIFCVMIAQMGLREVGMQVPGSDDLSAYLCVATTFFALAATFKRGELIRVGMGIEKLSPPVRRVAEILALLIAAAVVAYITWWTAQDVMFSWEIEEVAQGTVPFLIWIPKLAMPIGAGLLLVAIIDELVIVLGGAKPTYVVAAEDRAARGDFSAEV
ncbi:TRAP transporter small permease [Falsiroseomonas sp.]|uniref:TRAP transporter small permease n=1 Tax=Falsiroseomonas sp. TaxID=2870721 RepID=UPI003F714B49